MKGLRLYINGKELEKVISVSIESHKINITSLDDNFSEQDKTYSFFELDSFEIKPVEEN